MNYFKVSKDVTPGILGKLGDAEFRMEFGAELAKSDLAVILARARTEAGVSQAELGQRLGVSQSYVAKLESGNANPTLAATGRVFAALGQRLQLSTSEFLPGVEPGRR